MIVIVATTCIAAGVVDAEHLAVLKQGELDNLVIDGSIDIVIVGMDGICNSYSIEIVIIVGVGVSIVVVEPEMPVFLIEHIASLTDDAGPKHVQGEGGLH